MNNTTASPSIEVFLQPPSPVMNSDKLPSVKSLFPINDQYDDNNRLPSIRLVSDIDTTKLNTIEPSPSPSMGFSSPSSPSASSFYGSPLISPIQEGPFLLPPPGDMSGNRRCRSVSSNTSSPSLSPSPSFTFRCLSEPPTLNLPPSSKKNNTEKEYHHPIFGPKRKRGRPPNATRPESDSTADSHWTFVKPTVWNVKQQKIDSNMSHTPQFLSEATVSTTNTMDGINTFTSTNMDMALSIPKKKRGRKPKKQMAGNSCFVWRDLTAPRGANKKSSHTKKEEPNH